MSDEGKSDEPEGGGEKPKPPPLTLFVDKLHVSDRIALAALLTAVVATIVGVMQTSFMWIARNDEVEAALRSEQLRACVAYRIAGDNAIARAQSLAEDGAPPGDPDFQGYISAYQDRLGQLFYLLPVSEGSEVDDAGRSVREVYAAYLDGDVDELARLSADDEFWVDTHYALLDQCHAIIRDLRDR